MPTLVPGRTDDQSGFTLLEMMVALLIIGIATAMASVSAFGDDGARTLRRDAQRLGQLFSVAQMQARSTGRIIVWQHNQNGFAFEHLPRPMLLPARLAARASQAVDAAQPPGEPALRPRPWLSEGEVEVRIQPAQALVFDGEWIHDPVQIDLHAHGQAVRLTLGVGGRFVVQP
ncbi:MAG TPA: prepilin-type N-terminal cleavage/methylation domain-containing protein [Castellaniella sp.]|nr:prepilin-type N-terminal cleavage/methylation domain-containing protein [Castellaniella sp.]